MGYISKQLLKKAYNTLSGLTEDHKQGQTQIVSALRYIVALDMFYKDKKRSCDLGNSSDRDDFISNVKFVVNICDDFYTANFYTTIEEIADCRVGSNFFSQGVVVKSKTNTAITLTYPTRGSFPLFSVKNNNLYYVDSYLANISNYLPNDLLKTAFVIWLLRNENINNLSLKDVQDSLLTNLSSNLILQIIPKEEEFEHFIDGYLLDNNKPSISPADFLQMFETTVEELPQRNNRKEPLQQIFYGAPGTGKSHKIKEREKLLDKDNVFRTTFHPDSDYASFVGAYKPTMEERPMRVVPVVISEKGTMFEQNQGTYIENKIEYSYVAQSFIKAYVRAWNIWTKDTPITGEKGKIDFKSKNGQYVIDSVDDNNLSYTRQFNYNLGRSKIKTTWDRIWKNGKFEIPQGRRTGASVEEAIATWIYDKLDDCNEGSLQIGLELFRKEIEKGDIAIQGKTQKYMFHRVDDSDEIIITTQNNTKKETVKKYYLSEEEEPTYELHSNIIDILADYDESDFDNAWEQLREDVNNGGKIENDNQDALNNKVLLVIEEINRGNCAQIFGDIFQLLDRGDEGFSDYPIDSDSDIEKYLRKKFEKLEFSAKQRFFINNCFCGQEVASKILEGKKLVLPPNLYIWATMNTSDQSLFPIDSAFKRRWDWKYMKIKNEGKEWKIEVKIKDDNNEENLADWWNFIRKINTIIASMTSSADKQLGYFFCKADKKTEERAKDPNSENDLISVDTFVSKVLFYLWNDVFKDYGFEDSSLFQYSKTEDGKETKKDLTFPDFYKEDSDDVNPEMVAEFVQKVMNWKKATNTED